MDQTIRHISKDIRSGKLLEVNIPKLFNYLADQYHNYAMVRLAMHYYTFYEAFCDEEGTWSRESRELTVKINELISNHILKSRSGGSREGAIRTADSIRKDIMKRMDVLTAYTDIFQTYEYVLNRVEYRFGKEQPVMKDEEFAKEILRYIFDTEDNVIINEKIKDIIGQLPIRFTKQKYFDLLKESIRAYLGAEGTSLDTYLYMLRTSAMLYREEGMDLLYPGLWEKKEQLSQMDYKDMTKEGYEKALAILQAATLTLEGETTVYFELQEIINEMYTLLLCSPYAGMVMEVDTKAQDASFSMIGEINKAFLSGNKEELPLELTEKFADMEGAQEEMSYEISSMEDALYEVNAQHGALTESLMLIPLLQVLLRSQKLLSSSMFINLEGEDIKPLIVDEARVEKEVKALSEELSSLFAATDRMVGRAVMANTINKMPVFFGDHKEVMDYVLYSLDRCTDIYEKAACFEIINEIMSE